MCGIAGYVDSTGASQDVLVRQLATMEHRGPDATGTHVVGPVALGQNRLAIIDLVTGDPPFCDESGSIVAVFNGEIYNFLTLRHELEAAGHTFRTGCDTEVLAHLAEDLEPVDIARRLVGMYAFAIWDGRNRRLVVGRDPLGKKPLHYWARGGRFVFGSEIKAVVAHPAVTRRFDPQCLPSYLSLGYVPTPDTALADIHSVPPGCVAIVDDRGGMRLERHWSPPTPRRRDQLDIGMREAADEVNRLLNAAVGRRLLADVPLGAFLSGGLDSSAVVAAMCDLVPGRVRTFTAGFNDTEGYDERPHARAVAQHLGTDHTELVVEADVPELLDRLVWHHDQPFGDSSALPTYLLSEATRAHVTVALCGDGGDELFGGYERFAAALLIDRVHALPYLPGLVGQLARQWDDRIGRARGSIRTMQRLLARSGHDGVDALHSFTTYVPERWIERLLPQHDPAALRVEGATSYRVAWADGAEMADLDRLLHVNRATYLLDDLLPKVDRMAMAHSLEVRSPLLDVDLLEFCARLPPHLKVRGTSLKRVLRTAMTDRLPSETLARKKHGFGAPIDRWFRQDLTPWVSSMLCSSTARVRQHLEPSAVDAMLARHTSGAENLGGALWTLLTLESFLRQLPT